MFIGMEFKRVSYAVEDRVATIALNRPEKRNALDDTMVRELTTTFSAAAKNSAVKVIVLSASGSAFCAGADLAYLKRISEFDLEENRSDSFKLANLFRQIYELRKPVIASVQGPALGGGCGLASVCDFVVASREQARFGYTEVRVGFIPAIVMLFLINRIGEGRAREMLLRGNIIGAEEAHAIGLVGTVVPHEELARSTAALAEEIVTENSPTSMGLCKDMLSNLRGMNTADGLDFAANMNAAARMTPECRRGVEAFLKKEKITW